MEMTNNFIETYYVTIAAILAFASFIAIYINGKDGEHYLSNQVAGLFVCCIWPFSVLFILFVSILIGGLLSFKSIFAALTDTLDYISDYVKRKIETRKDKKNIK